MLHMKHFHSTYLNAHNIRFAAIAHPEIGIGSGAIIVQIGTGK